MLAILGATILGLLCINSHHQHHICDDIILKEWAARTKTTKEDTTQDLPTGLFVVDCPKVVLCSPASYFRTEYGDTCINWRKNSIRWIYDHNHCRNPMRKERVWCYTGSGTTWEYCDVPFCIEPGQESMNSTVVEKQAIPVIITATIILATVSFFLVIVIFLIVANWYCNRGEKKDDTIELVEQSDSGIFSSQTTDISPP